MAGADLRTVVMLAMRHLVVRRARALFLLFGYALGAGVMMVLLSIGEAMLVQSRDVALVGGGDVTVLPEGIDLEGLRTGSMSGLFYGIDRARFLERQLIGGPRHEALVAATSPVIEHKLLYLQWGEQLLPLRAGGEIPSAAREVGAGLDVLAGAWEDEPGDRRFRRPSSQQLYDELDRFHSPIDDSTWAEWHYFSIAPAPDEWWYVTFLVGGALKQGRGAGQLLITRHRPGHPPARFEQVVAQNDVEFDTTGANVRLGDNAVAQRGGVYRIRGSASGPGGRVRIALEVVPQPNAYFPAVELRSDQLVSGYVVPAVRGTASGIICEAERCRSFQEAAAYHDHNWGVWRATTWEWGQARGRAMSIVYGGVLRSDSLAARSAAPYFLIAVDSLGVRQILRFDSVRYEGRQTVRGAREVFAPERLLIQAGRGADSLLLRAAVAGRAQATPTPLAGAPRYFVQLRGAFTMRGWLAGLAVADSGLGFFETFVERAPAGMRR